MVRVMIETSYDPPFTEEDWDASNVKLFPCLEERQVQWIRSFVSPDHRRTICEFEAPDAEALRAAYRRVGVPFDRIWVAEVREP